MPRYSAELLNKHPVLFFSLLLISGLYSYGQKEKAINLITIYLFYNQIIEVINLSSVTSCVTALIGNNK